MKVYIICSVVAVVLMSVGCSSNSKSNIHSQKQVSSRESKQLASPSTAKIKSEFSIEKAPPEPEPKKDAVTNWKRENFSNKLWKKIRKIYVLQYLKHPECILWALKHTLPKLAAEYLEKGYGMYWSSEDGIPRGLELGFVQARIKDEKGLGKKLANFEEQGKGKDYYLLVYVTAWYYSLNNSSEKAKALVDKADLFNNLSLHGVIIPREHLDALKKHIKNLPK